MREQLSDGTGARKVHRVLGISLTRSGTDEPGSLPKQYSRREVHVEWVSSEGERLGSAALRQLMSAVLRVDCPGLTLKVLGLALHERPGDIHAIPADH